MVLMDTKSTGKSCLIKVAEIKSIKLAEANFPKKYAQQLINARSGDIGFA